MFDYLIVGAGFAGSVIAERLHSINKKVIVIDERSYVGGNANDYYNEDGILVHRHGPHLFHTNSKDVWDYLSLFTKWHYYNHEVLTNVNGQLLPIPINNITVNKFFGVKLNQHEVSDFLQSLVREVQPEKLLKNNSESIILKQVGTELYEKFFKGYTTKQWGVTPDKLSATVCGRIPIRTNNDCRYFTDTYQALPLNGYTKLFEAILYKIPVILNYSYEEAVKELKFDKVIYTGPIDRFYENKLGHLPYRSLRFEHRTLNQEYFQEKTQINYPNEYDFTRIAEFKHATGQKSNKTTITYEYPCYNDREPYYPIPTEENQVLYNKYKELAEEDKGKVYFTGRLGTYKYLNMDAVVAQSLKLFKNL